AAESRHARPRKETPRPNRRSHAMAEEFQGQESLPTWISKPEIRSKIASKLAEMQQQLDRTRGAIQAFKHLLLTNPKVVGEAATRDHPYVRPPVQRSLDDLKDRAISIVESMAYIQTMLRGTYGASNFKGYALAAMEKG